MSSAFTRSLSPRQAEIADLVKSGKTSREIGEMLFIDSRTVDSHIDAIRNKLGVRSRLELAVALSGRAAGAASDVGGAQPAKCNIPLQRTTLFGRASQIQDIVAILRRSRLVTVTGAGGVGKSRIALAVGDAVLAEFSHGVWLVELAPLPQGSPIAPSIAQVLSVEEKSGVPLLSTLTSHLKHRALLLVLDNCEHIVAQAAVAVAALLRECAQLRILTTSREPLGIAGEKVYRLPSLTLPTPEEAVELRADAASRYASIALFVDRAQAVDHAFSLTDSDVPLVGEICRRLDGIPIAIELAAARVDIFSLRTLTAKLDDRFRTLSGGDRTALPRHRTVRALLDWSYNLLSERERALLRRVAIFSAGWTAEAAEAVCSDGILDAASVADVLSDLVRKSQVVADRGSSATRYRLLESLHEYAREKLDVCGERDTFAHRHAMWVAAFIAEASTALWTVPRRTWLATIMPEIDNTRAALAHALQKSDAADLSARIAAGLGSFLYYCGGATEGRRRIEMALQNLSSEREEEVTGLLCSTLSWLSVGISRVEAAERAIRIFGELGDSRRLAISYLSLAIAYRQMARYEESEAAAERSLEFFRQAQATRSTFYASALGWRASALIGLGRFDEARALFEEDIALYEALADEDRAAVERLNLAELEFASGNVRRALSLVEEAIIVFDRSLLETKASNEHSQVVPYLNAAAYQLILGDIAGARNAARKALDRSRTMDYPLYSALALQHLATVAALDENPSVGARLCGFVDEVLRGQGLEREPTEKITYKMLFKALRQRLSEPEIDDLRARGARLKAEDAVRLALGREAHATQNVWHSTD